MLRSLVTRAAPSVSTQTWAGLHRSRAPLWLILSSSWWQDCHSWCVIGKQQPGLYPSWDATPGKTWGQADKCWAVCPVSPWEKSTVPLLQIHLIESIWIYTVSPESPPRSTAQALCTSRLTAFRGVTGKGEVWWRTKLPHHSSINKLPLNTNITSPYSKQVGFYSLGRDTHWDFWKEICLGRTSTTRHLAEERKARKGSHHGPLKNHCLS